MEAGAREHTTMVLAVSPQFAMGVAAGIALATLVDTVAVHEASTSTDTSANTAATSVAVSRLSIDTQLLGGPAHQKQSMRL